ncbi:oxidation resistance protein [Colletotrichum truncatum]|uniref:Oxidation resistance protein n=1 Tax=Colletotrichum truncatum TaxID=5467 RepID=A0ACC3Z5T1_COLTU|nr:oxidation resistance protein [Colletotrichum truncatum]KAF6787251.1 oxidation resistance protein [Colletotrichum truncatum]
MTSHSPPETPSSSGALTPTHSSTNPSLSNSMISTMWSGLIRRFSSDIPESYNGTHGHPNEPSHLAHAYTEPVSSDAFKDGISGVFVPSNLKRTVSPFRPPPLDPIVLHGFKDSTPASARLLGIGVAEEIRIMLPERLRIIEDWKLVYSLEQDGASLATLYQKAAAYQGRRVGFVLVVRDDAGGTFGAYLSEYPHPAPKYFGNGECFLWRASTLTPLPPPPSADTTNLTRSTTVASPTRPTFAEDDRPQPSPTPSESIRFKAFPYSGVNDYYINCETGFLSVGAGDGHYGLWLDDSLDRGHSGRSQTFGNEPLSDEGEKFGVLGVELWVLGA